MGVGPAFGLSVSRRHASVRGMWVLAHSISAVRRAVASVVVVPWRSGGRTRFVHVLWSGRSFIYPPCVFGVAVACVLLPGYYFLFHIVWLQVGVGGLACVIVPPCEYIWEQQCGDVWLGEEGGEKVW